MIEDSNDRTTEAIGGRPVDANSDHRQAFSEYSSTGVLRILYFMHRTILNPFASISCTTICQ